jgi:isopentenyl-diphosphate delta-isomerase
MATEKRKGDHIKVCLTRDVEFKKGNGFEDYEFVNNSLPELDWREIDISADFLGRRFKAPFFIEAMTGGTKAAGKINGNLAKAARDLGVPMGIGSQRAMIENPGLSSTFRVKDTAPGIFLVGNIGALQIKEYGNERIRRALDEIKADALAVHINPAQEIAQGGNADWRGILDALKKLGRDIQRPLIVKEVGCGISGEVARALEKAGADAIDVSGAGGTSWVKIDSIISGRPFDSFFEWGIPTAKALQQCARSVRLPLIASGGIRDGIDAAKALSMGASLAGLALPLLKPATHSSEAVKSVINQMITELKTVMFLVSAVNLAELKGKAVKV